LEAAARPEITIASSTRVATRVAPSSCQATAPGHHLRSGKCECWICWRCPDRTRARTPLWSMDRQGRESDETPRQSEHAGPTDGRVKDVANIDIPWYCVACYLRPTQDRLKYQGVKYRCSRFGGNIWGICKKKTAFAPPEQNVQPAISQPLWRRARC